jgi:hypothetical protein
MWKHANFLIITGCIGLEVEWGTQNIFSQMYLEDILCLPIVVLGYVWYYPYITLWNHANFHMVFEYYWLYRVGSGMVDPKYLLSDVFGRYFVPTNSCPWVCMVLSIHIHVETCTFPHCF